MKDQIQKVREFHDAFHIENAEHPCLISINDFLLRYELLREENEEYLKACQEENLTEIADALGDMLYILCGTLLKHGLQHKIEAIFEEIHRSNMSKLDSKGKPVYREDGKVMKSELYFRPDIRKILEQ